MLPASNAKSLPLLLSRRDGQDAESSFSSRVGGSGEVEPALEPASSEQVSEASVHDHGQREWLDRAGIALSAICALHCALTPLLVAVAPFLFTTEFEFRTKAVLLSLAVVALGWGFVTHRSYKPLVWLGVALGAFGAAEWLGHGEGAAHGAGVEIALTVLASLALITAHFANVRACRGREPHGHSVSWMRRGARG